MKKLLLILPIAALVFTGCGVYGQGKTTGYIYAVDDGIVWDKVWYKSSLDSSESDCYLINDDVLKEKLQNLDTSTRVTLHYDRHITTIGLCPEGTATDDVITFFEVANQ